MNSLEVVGLEPYTTECEYGRTQSSFQHYTAFNETTLFKGVEIAWSVGWATGSNC